MAKKKTKVIIDPNQSVRIYISLRLWQIEALNGREATMEVIYSLIDALTSPTEN